MRRLVIAVIAIGAVGLPVTAAGVVTSSALHVAAAPTALSYSLTGSAVGGVKTASFQDPVTFLFTEKDTGTVSASEDLVLQSLTNGSVVSVSCVSAGSIFNPDGNNCEPGFLHNGQSTSSVINTRVTGSSGTMSITVCVFNEGNGHTGPCKRISVTI